MKTISCDGCNCKT